MQGEGDTCGGEIKQTSFRNLRRDEGLHVGNGSETMQMNTESLVISEVELSRQWR